MNLDPVTLAFEAINFLVLLWLLRRFAFEPVRALLVRRREEIEAGKREVAVAKEALATRASELDSRIAEHERARDELMGQSRSAARAEAESLVERARNEVAHLEQEASAALAKLERRTVAGARTRIAQLAAAAAGRIVSEAAGETLDGALARRAAQQLRISTHGTSLPPSSLAIRVEVAPTANVTAISDVIARELSLAPSSASVMEFRTRDDVVAGVRITLGDRLVDATVAQALASWVNTVEVLDDGASGVAGLDVGLRAGAS